jgi:hypothetical protein
MPEIKANTNIDFLLADDEPEQALQQPQDDNIVPMYDDYYVSLFDWLSGRQSADIPSL